MCFFETESSGGHFNRWWIEDLTWTPSTVPTSLFRVIFVKTAATDDDFLQHEGWLHSARTYADKRRWTASKAQSVSLSESHWQTWSAVRTGGSCNRDLFVHGRKGSLVWQGYRWEVPDCLALTTSSQALQEACPKSLLLASRVSLLEVHSLRVRVLWGATWPGGPGPGESPELSLSQPCLCSCFEGSTGKLLFHLGELGKKSNKYGKRTLTSSRISLPLRP